MGRPVGVALDKGGAPLVADDVGNAIWRVTRTIKASPDRRAQVGPPVWFAARPGCRYCP